MSKKIPFKKTGERKNRLDIFRQDDFLERIYSAGIAVSPCDKETSSFMVGLSIGVSRVTLPVDSSSEAEERISKFFGTIHSVNKTKVALWTVPTNSGRFSLPC